MEQPRSSDAIADAGGSEALYEHDYQGRVGIDALNIDEPLQCDLLGGEQRAEFLHHDPQRQLFDGMVQLFAFEVAKLRRTRFRRVALHHHRPDIGCLGLYSS